MIKWRKYLKRCPFRVGCKKYGIFAKKCSFVFLNPYLLGFPLIAHVPDIYPPLFPYYKRNKGIRGVGYQAPASLLRVLLKIRVLAISFFERNGTSWRMCASIFYRYYIPNGMTALIKRNFIDYLVFSTLSHDE